MSCDFFAANANRAFEHYQAELVELVRAWEAAVAAKETASEIHSEHIENQPGNASSYEGVPSWTWLAGTHIILGYTRIAEA